MRRPTGEGQERRRLRSRQGVPQARPRLHLRPPEPVPGGGGGADRPDVGRVPSRFAVGSAALQPDDLPRVHRGPRAVRGAHRARAVLHPDAVRDRRCGRPVAAQDHDRAVRRAPDHRARSRGSSRSATPATARRPRSRSSACRPSPSRPRGRRSRAGEVGAVAATTWTSPPTATRSSSARHAAPEPASRARAPDFGRARPPWVRSGVRSTRGAARRRS